MAVENTVESKVDMYLFTGGSKEIACRCVRNLQSIQKVSLIYWNSIAILRRYSPNAV